MPLLASPLRPNYHALYLLTLYDLWAGDGVEPFPALNKEGPPFHTSRVCLPTSVSSKNVDRRWNRTTTHRYSQRRLYHTSRIYLPTSYIKCSNPHRSLAVSKRGSYPSWSEKVWTGRIRTRNIAVKSTPPAPMRPSAHTFISLLPRCKENAQQCTLSAQKKKSIISNHPATKPCLPL